VSQVSKRLRESDLIHKAYNALARTLETENTEFVEMEDVKVKIQMMKKLKMMMILLNQN